jgi:hypothetical protein
MHLIYRGELINRPNRPIPIDRKPYALNWRYQKAGESYETVLRAVYKPRVSCAINWRWQASIPIR